MPTRRPEPADAHPPSSEGPLATSAGKAVGDAIAPTMQALGNPADVLRVGLNPPGDVTTPVGSVRASGLGDAKERLLHSAEAVVASAKGAASRADRSARQYIIGNPVQAAVGAAVASAVATQLLLVLVRRFFRKSGFSNRVRHD